MGHLDWSQMDLFFGFFVTDHLESILKTANPNRVDLFLKGKDETYLQEAEFEKSLLIGKFLKTPTSIKDLKLLEEHIKSIATKVLPKETIDEQPLRLIALSHSS